MSAATRTIRKRLDAQRRALVTHYRKMNDLADDADISEREPELVDAASDEWDRQLLSRIGDADAAAVGRVDAALARLDAGTYGKCVLCHQRIEPERLHVLPDATRCFACAVRADRRARRA